MSAQSLPHSYYLRGRLRYTLSHTTLKIWSHRNNSIDSRQIIKHMNKMTVVFLKDVELKVPRHFLIWHFLIRQLLIRHFLTDDFSFDIFSLWQFLIRQFLRRQFLIAHASCDIFSFVLRHFLIRFVTFSHSLCDIFSFVVRHFLISRSTETQLSYSIKHGKFYTL